MGWHPPQFSWTDEAVAELKRLHADGLSFGEMAIALVEKFGGVLSRSAAIGKSRRLKLDKWPSHVSEKREPRPRRQVLTRIEAYRQRELRRRLRIQDAEDSAGLEATDLPPETSEHAVSLLQLEAHHCRWPIGDPQSSEFKFCGADKHEGAYCAKHARIAYAGKGRRERDVESEIRRRKYRRSAFGSFHGEAV